jgi:hypothetical protein
LSAFARNSAGDLTRWGCSASMAMRISIGGAIALQRTS